MDVVSCAKNTNFDFGLYCFHSGQPAALSEERDKPMNDQPIVAKHETRIADNTSLKVDQFAYTHKIGGFCSFLLSEEHFDFLMQYCRICCQVYMEWAKQLQHWREL